MKLYGGFIDGKLHWIEIDDKFGGSHWRTSPAVFNNLRDARRQYEDVREIVIHTLSEKPKQRRS